MDRPSFFCVRRLPPRSGSGTPPSPSAAPPRESQVVGVGVDARPRRGRRSINDLGVAGEPRQIEKAEYMMIRSRIVSFSS
jgi:hypothetical protein